MAADQKFNVPINMLGLEIRNMRLQVLAAAPGLVNEGALYYSSASKTPMFFDGTEHIPLDARKASGIPLSALAVNPLNRANHTGQQLAETISNFDAQVRVSRLDQMAAPTAIVSFNGQRLTALAAPTAGTDAATKAYVDAANSTGNSATATRLATSRSFQIAGIVTATAQSFDGTGNVTLTTTIADAALSIAKTSGLQAALNAKQDNLGYNPVNRAGDTMTGMLTLSADPSNNLHAATKQYVDQMAQQSAAGIDPKEAVNAAFTTNVTRTGTPTAQAGHTFAVGQRVLLMGQTNSAENGIYVISPTGTWPRSEDGGQGRLTSGAMVLVLRGLHAGSQWWLQTNDPINVGTTAQSWVQFGAVTPYTAGDGVEIVNNAISVKAQTGGGIIVGAGGVALDTTVAARKRNFTIGDGTTKQFTCIHNLGTQDVTVSARNIATNDLEIVGVTASSDSQVTVDFAGAAPGNNAYRITVVG